MYVSCTSCDFVYVVKCKEIMRSHVILEQCKYKNTRYNLNKSISYMCYNTYKVKSQKY